MKQLSIKLTNIGPHESLDLVFKPGLNILKGPNGAGKTNATEAIVAAMGGKANVTIRDGQTIGSVIADGVLLLQLGKRLTRAGQPTVEIGGYGPIGDVIDPGIQDPIKADAARVKAILAMSPIPVTEEVIKTLTQDTLELNSLTIPDEKRHNILAVADYFRVQANELALVREKEAGSTRMFADLRSSEMGQMDQVECSVTVADAQRATESVAREHTRVALLAEQRKVAEERQRRVREELKSKPDIDALRAERDEAQKAHESESRVVDAIQEEYNTAVRRLSEAKGRKGSAAARVELANESIRAADVDLGQWVRQQAVINEPIEGPTDADVEQVTAEFERAKAMEVKARAADALRAIRAEIGAALEKHEEHRDKALHLRAVAAGVSGALATVLSKHGIEGGLSINERRLYADVGKGPELFAERLSAGQRARIALKIALHSYHGRVVTVGPAFYSALQPKVRKELDEIAKEMDVMLVTEEPSDDDVITVVGP